MTTLTLSHVRQLRKRLGLTQHQLAKRVGVSQSLIAKLETGRIDPTFSKGKAILDHLEDMVRSAEPGASDIMTKNVVMIDAHKLLSDAIDIMRKHGISQVPVVDKDKLVGIISEEIILDASQKKKSFDKLTIRSVMASCPPLVDPTAPRAIVTTLLKHYPAVLVVEQGVLLGIITKTDILANLV
ncbi:CBS domain-containing protein [Candidatus Woesearchaeota archaeon]|nr:CBS domain-containing protein [Candidatus Woesearchaeota archaeon]